MEVEKYNTAKRIMSNIELIESRQSIVEKAHIKFKDGNFDPEEIEKLLSDYYELLSQTKEAQKEKFKDL